MNIQPIPHSSRRAQVTVTWAAGVEGAESVHDVIELARDFLAQFTPYEIFALPQACKPPAKIVDADDITAYAFALMRHQCAEGAHHAEMIRKMAGFFSHAAHRLAYLAVSDSREGGA
ncbi:MAG TPA: hypothetical protein VFE23_15315 [Usitatibacter sp.]|jgi:hypothetical protein|nr:hypothetical protein [Usitatibacter sp.]